VRILRTSIRRTLITNEDNASLAIVKAAHFDVGQFNANEIVSHTKVYVCDLQLAILIM